MTKLLVFGTGPLLEPGVGMFSSHGLRTWHIAKPLLDAGHEVLLFTQPIFDPEDERQRTPGMETREYKGTPYRAFRNCDDRHNIAELEKACREFQPDALIGVNAYPCAVLSRVNYRAPLWADLNGSVTIEGQIKARGDGSDALLGHYWGLEEASLRRADRFSTVSERQMYLLYGQLSAVGRMNRHTFAHPFADVIPNAFYPFFADRQSAAAGKMKVRGGLVPEDAFIVLWSGCHNVWTDFSLVQRALEMAMEACPGLYYVSTGGPVHGHDDLSYPRFRESLARSRFADRFHLLGWIDGGELPNVYAQSDVGVQVDGANFETVFGARNRTINMLAAGLPVLTTRGAEISEELIAAGGAAGCANDSAEDLARGLIELYQDRARLRELARRGRDYVLERFTYHRTTERLVAWAAAPGYAPDNAAKLEKVPEPANPFFLPANPIETRWYGENHRRGTPQPPSGHSAEIDVEDRFRSPLKRAVRRFVGTECYVRMREARRKWSRRFGRMLAGRRENPGPVDTP